MSVSSSSDHESRYYRFATPLSIAALIVSLASAGFGWWQGKLVGQYNDLFRTSTIVSQRAFIFFDSPSVDEVIDATTGVKNARLGLPLINGGNTATKGLEFFVRCAPSIDKLPEPWVLLYRDNPSHTSQLIGPHHVGRAYCTFTLEQLRQIKDGKLYGYLLADVTYHDKLDDSILHRSQWSTELLDINITDPDPRLVAIVPSAAAQIGISFNPIGKHNCADEECPQN